MASTNRARACLFASTFAILLSPLRAFAESADDATRAQALFEQAKQAMDAGDYAHACPKLEEAQHFVRGIGVTLHLADCYEKAGRTASAWAQFKTAEALAKDKHDPREKVAHDHATALEPHLARVRISVTAATDGLVVHQDGTAIGQAEWGSTLPIDPGDHLVVASAPGFRNFETHVAAKSDALVEVSVPALEKAVKESSVIIPVQFAEPPVSDAGPPPKSHSHLTWVAWTGAGVAVAGAGLGAVTGILTLDKASSIKTACPSSPCPAGSESRVNGLKSDGQTFGAISTVSFIVAGAGALVFSGAWIFGWGGAKDSPSARVDVGPGSVLFHGEF